MSEELHPDRISELIAEATAGSLSEEQRGELERWAAGSARRSAFLESLRAIEAVQVEVSQMHRFDAESGWKRVVQRRSKRRLARFVLPLTGVAVAAAVALGIFLFPSRTADLESRVATMAMTDQSAVRLYRATGEVIAVDTIRTIALQGAVVESDGGAMTVVPLVKARDTKLVYNEIVVPEAKRFDVILADGTHVQLNSGSRLRFPEQFSAQGRREVYLSGEAFFEVQKDESRPFVVHAGSGYVRVTGTEFNVNCYDDSPSLVTTLVAGRVLIGGAVKQEVALIPGMQAVQARENGVVMTSMVDVSEAIAWREGLFAFREQPLDEIMTIIARWYGCKVRFESVMSARVCFTGKMAQSSTLTEVAGYFSRTGEVLVREEQGTLVIR